MKDLDFERDSFEDILAKDKRYAAGAYTLIMDVVQYLGESGKHVSANWILDEFRERTLDLYGPLSLHVLKELGIESCSDIGAIMGNLVAAGRVGRDPDDSLSDFDFGFDFEEAFTSPFNP